MRSTNGGLCSPTWGGLTDLTDLSPDTPEETIKSLSEFNEFEPRLKSAKNRLQLSASLNLKKVNTISSGIEI